MKRLLGMILVLGISQSVLADSYEDFFKKFKDDPGMESKHIPPKLAALFIDEEDYPDAVDVLGSLNSLKYLNFIGDAEKVEKYTHQALAARSNFVVLGETESYNKKVFLFGIRKNDFVKKVVAVVQKKKEFYLVIGKGKLTEKQIKLFPSLADEI